MSKKENVLGLDLKADSVGASDSGKVFQNLGQKQQMHDLSCASALL